MSCFILGYLFAVLTLFLVGIVIGTVYLFKFKKRLVELEYVFDNFARDIEQSNDNSIRDIKESNDEIYRHIEKTNSDLYALLTK